jgi:hypothetical protein
MGGDISKGFGSGTYVTKEGGIVAGIFKAGSEKLLEFPTLQTMESTTPISDAFKMAEGAPRTFLNFIRPDIVTPGETFQFQGLEIVKVSPEKVG